MSAVLIIAGMALLAVTLADMFKTALTSRGAGPITARMAAGAWWLAIRLHRHLKMTRILTYSGPGIAVLTVLFWLLLQWTAWTLIFSAGDPGIVESRTGRPAGLWERVYYVGYTLATLGLGDYRPEGAAWQILSAIVAGSGFLSISLSATYLIPVVSAAARKRELAIYVQGLGGTPMDIVRLGWNGRDFSVLGQHLTSLTPLIIEVAQQHLIYPVLYYFHAMEREISLTTTIAALDEALHLLSCGVHPDHRMPDAVVAPASHGIESLLACLGRVRMTPTDIDPPVPLLEPLRRAGIPVASEVAFRRSLQARSERRRLTLSLVEDSGWGWADVVEHERAVFAAAGGRTGRDVASPRDGHTNSGP